MIHELRYRWFLFNIKDNGMGNYIIEANDCYFNYKPKSELAIYIEEKIDKYHDQKLYEQELEKRYPNLKFNKIEVYVKTNGVFTGFTLNPDDKEMFNKLKSLNDECQLITEHPDKYTFCTYCQSVVPHDYVAAKYFGGVICKHCEALTNKEEEWKH